MLKQSALLFILLAFSNVIQMQGHILQKVDNIERLDVSSVREKRQAEINFDTELPLLDDLINICDNSTLDAIFTLRDGTSYIFRESLVWKIVRDKIAKGFPAIIGDTFPGLEDNLDAAFSYIDDTVAFFKGSQCWKYKDNKMLDGYPQDIQKAFPGIPDNIDGVTPWGTQGYIYFFKGDNYWRFEPNNLIAVRSVYPKLISDVWRGMPTNVDDVSVHSNGITYFFKGIRYWRFNDDTLAEYIERQYHVPYPRLIAPWWLSCKPEP